MDPKMMMQDRDKNDVKNSVDTRWGERSSDDARLRDYTENSSVDIGRSSSVYIMMPLDTHVQTVQLYGVTSS
jgi:hypothetical protein